MSTLNSSQLCVKRSSTRLHAPPGGASSLSFGPGGFGGAVDQEVDKESEPLAEGNPAALGYYNHPDNNQYDGVAPQAFHAIKASYPGAGYDPSASAYARGATPQPMVNQAGAPPSTSSSSAYGRPLSSATNDYSWGERGGQPPLTSSKRDQNWEKKRRLWLARKGQGGGGGGGGRTPASSHGRGVNNPGALPMPPPMTGFGTGEGGYDQELTGGNPPSPLTKFVAQQNQKQALPPPSEYDYPPTTPGPRYDGYDGYSGGGGGGGGGMRSSRSSHGQYQQQQQQPPYQPQQQQQQQQYQYPPPTQSQSQYYAGGPPPSTATSMNGGYGGGGYGGGGYGGGGYGGGGAGYSGGGGAAAGRATPGTASSSSSSGSRQPPGGRTNWNPYS